LTIRVLKNVPPGYNSREDFFQRDSTTITEERMKTRTSVLLFLLTVLAALLPACSFDAATNLFATPTPTATNTPLPTATPTITPSPTATVTPTATVPPPTATLQPGDTYSNSTLGFEVTFPAGVDYIDLGAPGGFPMLAGASMGFLLGGSDNVTISGFSLKTELTQLPMNEILDAVTQNFDPGETLLSSEVSVNPQGVELGTVTTQSTSLDRRTKVYFVAGDTLVYFYFLYENTHEDEANAISAFISETILLK
jgi:hypothetical protein